MSYITGVDGTYNIYHLSYTDNGNGTIKDNVTGLLWQKGTNDQSGPVCATGSAKAYNWYQSSGTHDDTNNPNDIDVCGSLSLAGGGWRLPTDYELLTIANYGDYWPAMNLGRWEPFCLSDMENGVVHNSYYWSSNTYAFWAGSAWFVNFGDGSTGNLDDKSNLMGVRCVRGTEYNSGSSFADNNNGTVTDLTTNLVWQQCSPLCQDSCRLSVRDLC